VVAFATIASTAAIFRAGLRIFVGLGDPEDPVLSQEPSEGPPPEEKTRLVTMLATTLLLALAGLLCGAWTGLATRAVEAAHTFTDRAAYAAAVLQHRTTPVPPPESWHTTTSSIVWSIVTLGAAIAVGFGSVYRNRMPEAVTRTLTAAYAPLRAVHSGHIGDYVAWLTFGTAVIGGLFAVTIR
jgi:multicomponent Na+:H+ antiporter subunit D